MQQSTQQRIVGSIVLLALALIILPIIFDGEGSYQPQLSSRIPEAPELLPMPRPIAERPVVLAEQPGFAAADDNPVELPATDSTATVVAVDGPEASDDDANKAAPVEESSPDFSREVPQLAANGLPQAWSVRLGSFAEAANASELMQRLQDSGYKAYTREVASQQGTLTAVFVGPWLDRTRVDDYLQELQEQFRLTGMVVRYEMEAL